MTHPTPIANSYKLSHFLSTVFPGAPPLAGAGPAKHISAVLCWKLNIQLADLFSRGFFWLRTEMTLTSAELGTRWLLDSARLPAGPVHPDPVIQLHHSPVWSLPGAPGGLNLAPSTLTLLPSAWSQSLCMLS